MPFHIKDISVVRALAVSRVYMRPVTFKGRRARDPPARSPCIVHGIYIAASVCCGMNTMFFMYNCRSRFYIL